MEHKELHSALPGDLSGKEIQEREMCAHMVGLLS